MLRSVGKVPEKELFFMYKNCMFFNADNPVGSVPLNELSSSVMELPVQNTQCYDPTAAASFRVNFHTPY